MTENDAKPKGEKQISMESRNMTECARKLAERANTEPDIDDHLLYVIKDLLEQSQKLEKYTCIRLDQLARHKEKEKDLIQAWPKLAYEIFSGQVGSWPVFQRNKHEIYKLFSENGEGQQINQLLKILSANLAETVMSFSGAQDGAAKAVHYLNDRFNSPHLILPKVYDKIREWPQAHTQSQVPHIAEKLLRHV